MDHKELISKRKSMVIAPAGHGKTHSIIECLHHTEGKQLILTHTHSGIAAINEKIKRTTLESRNFHIETISGFAQKYVQAYYMGVDVPSRGDSELYYIFMLKTAKKIISNPLVSKMLKVSYSGLFVDEYQDCSLSQHELILALGELLPTRIFGDPLQGIFNFSDPLVNLCDSGLMDDFYSNQHTLNEPWRWKGINEPLGLTLQQIRKDIETNTEINFKKYPAIEFIQTLDEADLYNPTKPYNKEVRKKLTENKSILIIYPDTSSVNPRKKIIGVFSTPITLLEAIDDKDFYLIAKMLDSIVEANFEKTIHQVCEKLFSKTELNKWMTDKKVVSKRSVPEKMISDSLAEKYDLAKSSNVFSLKADLLRLVSRIPKVACYRKELLNNLCIALTEADHKKSTVYEAMTEKRNKLRKVGRNLRGRCIGTTLLTKGLEFETVMILNINKFKCPKNFYVALTRASKKLIVFGTSEVINFQN